MAIINQGRLVALGTATEIREAANATDLEDAFMRLTGGVDRDELLAWEVRSCCLKWAVIAKYEYMVKTSGIRRWRYILPTVAAFAIILYIFILAPAVFALFEQYTSQFILSDQALGFMQVFLLVIFASIITIPIMQTLQDNRVSPLEAVIASPVRPVDVLMGRFLGSLPFYCLVVVLIAGTFLALFIPFGMSPAQVALSVLVFLLVVVSGLWIGILLAAVLKANWGERPGAGTWVRRWP